MCTPPAPISRRPGKARPSTLGLIRRRPRHPRGAASPNLHPQRTIAHPPMPRSTSDPLSARQMKRWARRETAQQNHRGAAQNSCCGRSERSVGTDPAESSHCSPQIAQSTSRWFSARGREASAGSDRGSPLPSPRGERGAIAALPWLHAQNERINHPRTQLQRAGCPDTEDNDRGCRQRIGNDRNQEDTAGTASSKRREPAVILLF